MFCSPYNSPIYDGFPSFSLPLSFSLSLSHTSFHPPLLHSSFLSPFLPLLSSHGSHPTPLHPRFTLSSDHAPFVSAGSPGSVRLFALSPPPNNNPLPPLPTPQTLPEYSDPTQLPSTPQQQPSPSPPLPLPPPPSHQVRYARRSASNLAIIFTRTQRLPEQ